MPSHAHGSKGSYATHRLWNQVEILVSILINGVTLDFAKLFFLFCKVRITIPPCHGIERQK